MGVGPESDEVVNDIIIGQATRHAIVHNSGTADERCVAQVEHATPRTLKPVLRVHEAIEFSPPEIEGLAEAMREFLERLAKRSLDAISHRS